MSLTIKNPETLDVVRRLADALQVSQTAAITRAAAESLSRIETTGQANSAAVLLQEIWASQPPSDAVRVQRNLDSLYDERGVPQ